MREYLRCFVWFKHAFFSKMVKQFSAGNELQEHIDELRVLSDALEANLNPLGCTMKGCWMLRSIRYSLEMWSTCCDLISYSFFMIFTQQYLEVVFFLTRRTLPNEPG